MAAHGIDEAVLLTSFHQSPLPTALLLRLAGVTRISGASVDAAGGLLDTRLIPGETLPEELPEPVRALRIAEAAGFALPAGDDGRLAVALPGDAEPAEPGPYVVVHPGAAVPARAYPAAGHARGRRTSRRSRAPRARHRRPCRVGADCGGRRHRRASTSAAAST